MGLINPAIPTVGDNNSTEDPDIRNGMITIRDEFNGNIDNSNIKSAAQIVPSKLQDQTAGKILIANASGIITATTVTGNVTVNSSGVTAIGTDQITSAMILADAVGTSEIAADAVGTSELATDAVGSAEIAADAVGSSEIAASAVGNSEMADDAIGAAELIDNIASEAAISKGANVRRNQGLVATEETRAITTWGVLTTTTDNVVLDASALSWGLIMVMVDMKCSGGGTALVGVNISTDRVISGTPNVGSASALLSTTNSGYDITTPYVGVMPFVCVAGGSRTYSLRYAATAGTATFKNRYINVLNFGP